MAESTYNAPPLVDLTVPAPKEERVVEPLTLNVPVKEEEAKKEVPLTVKPVEEALASVDWPVTNKAPEVKTVEEALVTVRTLVPELKVKLVEVPTAEVPLPNRTAVEVKLLAPVPPLATGKMPVTLVVKSMVELVMSALIMRPLYKAPLVDLTTPVPKEDRVVEPVTDKVPVKEEEAKVDTPVTNKGPLTVRAVEEAVAKLDWPVTQRLPERERAVPEATPKIGVIKVGEVCRTLRPLPVLPVTYKAPPEVDWTVPAPSELIVVEPLAAMVNKEEPVSEATVKTLRVGEVEVPCTTKVALGVVEPMPTLWLAVTLKTETPVEEATLKISLVPAPWRLKVMEEDVALMPATVPLSLIKPWDKVLVPFQMETKPGLPEPMVVR